MKKILFTAKVAKTHINVFHIPYLKMLKDAGYTVHVAARNDFENEDCVIPYCDLFVDIQFTRNPFSKKNFAFFKQLKDMIDQEKYEIIHCHTPITAALTRLAAISARKKYGTKVFYTSHGFHFYRGSSLLSWLLYYPVEWLCSFWTDLLITINQEDYEIAKKMHAKRVEYVPGVGIDLEKFTDVCVDRGMVRQKLCIPEDAFLVASVGEVIKNKNHEVVLRALGKLGNPRIHYAIAGVAVAGEGDMKEYLLQLAEKLGIQEQVHFLGYRNDVEQLYAAADVCCFPSIREGLGLAALEGMASGLPLICADNRGTRAYARDGVNAIVCPWNDVDAFAHAIHLLYTDPGKCKEFGKNSKDLVWEYSCDNVLKFMREIYGSYLGTGLK